MAEPGFWDDGTAAQKLINENNELKTKIDNVQLNNDELRNELSKILDSKSWKILEKIRSIINKFRKLG